MFRKLYQLLILYLISINVYSQTNYTLNGYIKSASDGESLIGATIYINEIQGGVITNPYGFYSITLEEGEYNIEYRYIGYITLKKKIMLDKDQKIDIELLSEDIELENILITSESENENVSST